MGWAPRNSETLRNSLVDTLATENFVGYVMGGASYKLLVQQSFNAAKGLRIDIDYGRRVVG